MALTTTADYQTALYKILNAVDHSVGIDWETYVRTFGLAEQDKNQLINEYYNYRKTLPYRVARPSINIH